MAKKKVSEAHIARILIRQLGWVKGWTVTGERMMELCNEAARKITRYVERRKERA